MPDAPPIARRIFIVGFPRSGTTLVQSLLASHSALTSFTESHFFSRHFTPLRPLAWAVLGKDPSARVREFLEENGEAPPEAAAWFARLGRSAARAKPLLPLQSAEAARRFLDVLDQLARRRGRTGWIEKTPRHLRYVPFLERISGRGRTRFLHVLREGVDAVASLEQASPNWETPYDLEAGARRWNADVALSLRRVGMPADCFVLYEDLTASPEDTVRRLLAELGLAWEPGLLDRYTDTARRVTTGEEPWKAETGGSIRRSNAADRTLAAAQRERLGCLLRPELYERIRDSLARRRGHA